MRSNPCDTESPDIKLKRNVAARNSLLRGLVTSVIENDFVITTVPKAKAVRPLVDKMITLAKDDTLHSRRQAAAFLRTPASVQKLFDKLGTKFGQRNGGYTRIVRAWAGARAMAPSWPSSNWSAPNWSSAPPNAPSAAKSASRQFKKAVNTKGRRARRIIAAGN